MSSSDSQPKRALLLLPPAPFPSTYAALKAAYHGCLFVVHQQLSRHDSVVLDVALPCPHLYGHLDSPRGSLYSATQSLIANLYKLICIIAAQRPTTVSAIDARIILLAYPRNGRLTKPSEGGADEEAMRGPVVDLATLARSPRPWETVYSVESEEGEGLLRSFLALSRTERHVKRVRGGIVPINSALSATAEDAHIPAHHFSVAVGGTFDHLHIGHKLLLTMFAFVLAHQTTENDQSPQAVLTLGITGDALLKNKKYAEVLESWDVRQLAVHDFLSSLIHLGDPADQRIMVEKTPKDASNGRSVQVIYPDNLVIKYVEIMDPFGPTITDESISALVISQETRSGGGAVNEKRSERGWTTLEIFEVDVLEAREEEGVADETFQSKLSSTEIRRNLLPAGLSTSS